MLAHNHNPTMSTVHNIDVSKQLAPTWRFPSVPVAIESKHLLTEVSYEAELQSGQDPGNDDERADELP
jgi:hypothetical protein